MLRKRRRSRRTKAQIGQLDTQIIELLKEDWPLSVRHIYYQMTNPRLPEYVEKTEQGYQQIGLRTRTLREKHRIPYAWITDATRRGYHVATYEDAADFMRQMQGRYRANLWDQSACYCEVWCESRSIAGVIEKLCRELCVSLYPSGGFTSYSLAYDAAETIVDQVSGASKSAVIYYIGDYDPAGVLIDKNIEHQLRKYIAMIVKERRDQGEEIDDIDLSFERIAINKDQIKDHDLPTKPRKADDKRSKQVKETVEAEAMPANVLRDLLRGKIEGLLPDDALRITKTIEEDERKVIDGLAKLAENEAAE